MAQISGWPTTEATTSPNWTTLQDSPWVPLALVLNLWPLSLMEPTFGWPIRAIAQSLNYVRATEESWAASEQARLRTPLPLTAPTFGSSTGMAVLFQNSDR